MNLNRCGYTNLQRHRFAGVIQILKFAGNFCTVGGDDVGECMPLWHNKENQETSGMQRVSGWS